VSGPPTTWLVYFAGRNLTGDPVEIAQAVDAHTRLAAWRVVAAEHQITPKNADGLKVVAVHGPQAPAVAP
jgi:hypothetical protein